MKHLHIASNKVNVHGSIKIFNLMNNRPFFDSKYDERVKVIHAVSSKKGASLMYKRMSFILFPVLVLGLVGAIIWGYQVNQEKNSVLIKAENNYQIGRASCREG